MSLANCPECQGDGYVDLLDDDGFVIGPGPCPNGCDGGTDLGSAALRQIINALGPDDEGRRAKKPGRSNDALRIARAQLGKDS